MPALTLYRSGVVHRRRERPAHAFTYRVFNVLLDIDRLDEAAREHRLFSHNRFNLVAFHDRDHGPKDGGPLRPWIEARLAEAGVDLAGGQILLLAYPRVLGYVFNPLTLWYCHHADGTLRAVLCEVRNTFGEWHGYLLHDDGRPLSWPVRDRATKVFHVSPFQPVAGEYRFRFSQPADTFAMTVNYYHDALDHRPALIAVQRGETVPAGNGGLLRCVLAMPLMTVKVMAAIHWQALRLWLRGGRYHSKPEPPGTEISR